MVALSLCKDNINNANTAVTKIDIFLVALFWKMRAVREKHCGHVAEMELLIIIIEINTLLRPCGFP